MFRDCGDATFWLCGSGDSLNVFRFRALKIFLVVWWVFSVFWVFLIFLTGFFAYSECERGVCFLLT